MFPKKYSKILFVFLMGLGMSLLMTLIITFINTGYDEFYYKRFFKAWSISLPVALVEQNAKQALSISDRGYVLVTGQNKFEGSGNDLLEDPEVRRSFLGA